MPTLFRLKPAGAKRAHTCDARCYNAKGTTCKCFCNGANHGKGLAVAIQNCKDQMQKYMDLGCEIGKELAKAIQQAVAELTQ